MKPHHLLECLLVAVNGLAAAAIMSLAHSLHVVLPDPLALVFLGAALGQIGLVAAWVVWGRWLLAVRAFALLGVMLGWLIPMVVRDQHRAWWGGVLLLHVMCVVGALTASRLAGARLGLDDEPAPAPSRIKPWQFSVGGVLTLTTLLAMLLGVARHFDFPWQDFVSAASFCVATAAASAISLYAAFRLSHVGLALFIPPVVCCAVGYVFWRIMLPDVSLIGVGMGSLHGGVISLSAGVLRIAGYRIVPADWRDLKSAS